MLDFSDQIKLPEALEFFRVESDKLLNIFRDELNIEQVHKSLIRRTR